MHCYLDLKDFTLAAVPIGRCPISCSKEACFWHCRGRGYRMPQNDSNYELLALKEVSVSIFLV